MLTREKKLFILKKEGLISFFFYEKKKVGKVQIDFLTYVSLEFILEYRLKNVFKNHLISIRIVTYLKKTFENKESIFLNRNNK